ncbi:PTS glucose transporter subunit IIBC [Erysipelothrix urinaevulpis]|uniref:PTS glucose transporter subunit IIBC n=1 Tax=Erysipelothrix urinaevulpis TaxID=2683717 RepID=UPI001357358A|nr:PTS glucose transporter subunit IIBC [Erysipelothrix urinaevulpis]
MNRIQSYYEQLQFPIKLLFLSSFLIAIGSLFLNPYISTFINIENTIIFTIAQILTYCGGIILSYFPFYVFIKLLAHRKDEPNIVITGIISYIIFIVVLTILSPAKFEPSVYEKIGEIVLLGETTGIYKTGIFGLLGIYLIVTYVYQSTKDSKLFSMISYVDRDTVRFIYSIVGAGVLAFGFSFLWPIVIEYIYKILNFVSTDVNNPMTMFAYGGFDRLMTLFNLDSIVHSEMWFGSLGGTWVDLSGVTFNGDVTIWMAQLNENMNIIGTSDAGRFTSAYYVLNLFAIPAYLIGIYSTFSNKQYLTRNIFVLLLAILISMVSGVLLPIELLMIVTSPILYVFHLFMTSLIFAVLSGLSVYLGFSYTGNLLAANPGNLIDLIFLFRRIALVDKIMIMLLVGAFVFIAYFAMTRLYYGKLALDILNIGNKEEKINDFIERLGGIENVSYISSTPTRIHVQLENREKLNVAGMHQQGVTRIIETKQGFVLSIGSSSYIYQKEVNKKLKTIVKEEQVEVAV